MSVVINAGSSGGANKWPRSAGFFAALAMVAAATLVAWAFEQRVQIPNLSLIFVLPVVIAAVSFGWGASLAAAFAGLVAYNYFLIPPVYTFRVGDPANLWALGLLLTVAAIASAAAAQSRSRALEAGRGAAQAMALQTLARSLVAATDRTTIARACAEALARVFAAPVVILMEAEGALEPAAVVRGAELTDADWDAARWSFAARLPTRGGAYPAGEADYDFWPVLTPLRQGAVIGVALASDGQRHAAGAERLVEIVIGHLAVALDREAYARRALAASLEKAGERLKSDLLAAVSHDLRTPLSTVLFSLQSLRRFHHAYDEEARAQLLALAETETSRLTSLLENLLDMSRLEAGAVRAATVATAPADLIAAALQQAGSSLTGHRMELQIAPDARPLQVDPGLFASALAQVLENAGKYAPAGSTICVRNDDDGTSGWIDVEDEGAGLGAEADALFGKFTRGVSGDGRPPGLGLGLSIARGFLEAMGGRIEAANRLDKTGARFRLAAPLHLEVRAG